MKYAGWIIWGFAVAVFFSLPATGLCLEPDDLAGNWRIHTTSHRGYENWEMKIAVRDGKCELSCVQPFIGRCEGLLTLEDNRIKMEFIYRAPGGGPVGVEKGAVVASFMFNGTVDGETMHGTKTTIAGNTHGDDKPVAWVALKRHESY
jgi:hypothetical protein